MIIYLIKRWYDPNQFFLHEFECVVCVKLKIALRKKQIKQNPNHRRLLPSPADQWTSATISAIAAILYFTSNLCARQDVRSWDFSSHLVALVGDSKKNERGHLFLPLCIAEQSTNQRSAIKNRHYSNHCITSYLSSFQNVQVHICLSHVMIHGQPLWNIDACSNCNWTQAIVKQISSGSRIV